MFKKIEDELREKYKTSNFKIVEQNDNIEIFYDDKELKDNEKFMDFVFDVCEKYLKDDDLWRIAILYDYLGELSYCKPSVELTIQSNISYVQKPSYMQILMELDSSMYKFKKYNNFRNKEYFDSVRMKTEGKFKRIAKKINTFINYTIVFGDEQTRYSELENTFTLSRSNYICNKQYE